MTQMISDMMVSRDTTVDITTAVRLFAVVSVLPLLWPAGILGVTVVNSVVDLAVTRPVTKMQTILH